MITKLNKDGGIHVEQNGAITNIWIKANSSDKVNLLLRSDAHHDSVYCRRDIEEQHLKEAVNRGAWIIDCGDIFDAMQGKHDRRRNYDTLRPEYKVPHYYDAIVKDAVEFYKPYAQNWLLLGHGNHETAVLEHSNIDLISQLVGFLNADGANIKTGGYGGWIIFHFEHKCGGTRKSFKLRYFHGAGGEAPVTRGVIQTNRQATFLPDADLVVNGHNHNEYILSIKRERISDMGRQYFDLVHFARTPGYHDSYNNGSDGWEVERGGIPKPIGAIWAELTYKIASRKVSIQCKLTADII